MKRMLNVMFLALLLAPAGTALAKKPEWNRADDFNRNGTTEPKRLIPVPDPPDYDRPLRVDVWVDEGDDATFYPGETVTLHFRTNRDAFVLLYDIDTNGDIQRIYPRSRWDEQRVEGGVVYTVPNARAGYRLVAGGRPGYEYVGAVASDEPLGSRWDNNVTGWLSNGAYRGDFGDGNRGGFRQSSVEKSGATSGAELDRSGTMDRLYSRLIEVPVERRWKGPETDRDEVRFRIARPAHRRWK